MKELWYVLGAMAVFFLGFSTMVYPNIEHKGGGYHHACIDECYEELKKNRAEKEIRDAELAAYNEANGIVVEEPDPGERIWGGCMGCHGQNGEGGLGPKLSGQTFDYISGRLITYKGRGTVGKQSNMMWSQASALSDQDIDAVSKYISKEL
jgi:cytochrome c553